MYNNDSNGTNYNRTGFDGQMNESVNNTATDNVQSAETTYRYTYQNIPFNEQQNVNNSQNNNTSSANSGYSTAGQQYYGSSANMNYNYSGQTYTTANQTTDAYKKKPKKNKVKKEKKPNSFAKKALKFVAAAVLFGAIAGATMYGAYYAGYQIAPVSYKNYEISSVSSAINKLTNESGEQEDIELSNTRMNVEAVAQAALPAMVALSGTTTITAPGNNFFYGGFGNSEYEAATSGTGIIVGQNDTELLVLTNAHVVDDVKNLGCMFVDGEVVSATVKGSKSDQDIAVVAIKLADMKSSTLSSIAIAELANSNEVVLGQEVVAIGNALGEGQSVTNGIISALDRSITVDNVTFSGLFMTNAAINSGNSGGALLDAAGKVIAINFAKTSSDGVEGMAYSIPVSNVSDLIDSLMTRETREKVSESEASFLGIVGVDITASDSAKHGFPQGVMINSVAENSPAAEAGLGKYDIIVSFDDQTISSMTGLQTTMQYYKAGETVTIEYYHIEGSEYKLKSADVVLGKKN